MTQSPQCGRFDAADGQGTDFSMIRTQLCSSALLPTKSPIFLEDSDFSANTTVPAMLTLILSQYSSLQGVCILAFASVLLCTWRFWYSSYISSFLEIVTIIARTHGNLVCRPLASNYSVFWSVGFGVKTRSK